MTIHSIEAQQAYWLGWVLRSIPPATTGVSNAKRPGCARRGAALHCATQACGLGHCACSSGLHKWKGRGCLPAHAAANQAR